MTLPQVTQACKRCGSRESPMWWKCCTNHTTEQGPDVVCQTCTLLLHPGYADDPDIKP